MKNLLKIPFHRSSFALLMGCFFSLTIPWLAHAHSGSTAWGAWAFDWEVKDDSGLALTRVRYNSELFFNRINMPVIRVKYNTSGNGPYADKINWGHLLKISNCGNKKVCQRSFVAGGQKWLEIGILAAIGKYRLYQVYYLSENGYLEACCHSKGFHHKDTHQHHAYWRVDADVAGASNDQILVYNNNAPNSGFGPGWTKLGLEANNLKNPGTHRTWFVRDNGNGHGVWVLQGQNDSGVDAFSKIDVASRLYHSPLEGVPWQVGATGELGFDNSESIAERDVVVWYVAHLQHVYPGDPDHWGHMGFCMKVQQ
jgi:hypothetical protein